MEVVMKLLYIWSFKDKKKGLNMKQIALDIDLTVIKRYKNLISQADKESENKYLCTQLKFKKHGEY